MHGLLTPLVSTQTAVYRQNRPRRILTPGRDDTRTSRIRSNGSVAFAVGAFMHSGMRVARRGWRRSPTSGLSPSESTSDFWAAGPSKQPIITRRPTGFRDSFAARMPSSNGRWWSTAIIDRKSYRDESAVGKEPETTVALSRSLLSALAFSAVAGSGSSPVTSGSTSASRRSRSPVPQPTSRPLAAPSPLALHAW